MEIKNFANGFSSGRAKILTAILGCLAVGCVAIILSGVATDKNIATAYTFHDNICVTAYDTTKDVEKSTCNGFAEGDYACYDGYDGYAVRCNGRYWKDVKSWSQPKCYCKSQYANYAHIEYGKDIKITSAAPAATGTGGATSGEVKKLTFQDNAGTACVYSFNPQFASGKNGECRGNTYCFPYPAAFATEGGVGRCDIGCAIRDDGGNILDWYELGQTTCKKSGTNLTKSAFGTSLPDGVYECKKMSPSGDGAVTWKHNGAVWVEGRSSSITNDYYAFDLKNNCLTCQEDTKGNAYCRDNANNTNNTKCDEIKSRIQNQFSNYVKDTNYCRNSPTKESSKTWGEHYYNCYHGAGGVRERYINAFKDNGALSGAGGIIRVFERLAYPGGWRYGDKTMIETQGTFNFPNQTQVIGDNDILCDFNTTDGDGYLINKECNATVSGMNNYLCVGPASTLSSPFKGNSGGRQYQCARVDIGGGISCGMYNWVKNQSYVSCNSGRVEQFGTGGYFRKDSSGKPSYGWGKGADENGCEYISFANASGFLKTGGDDKEASSYSYREMRMPTGYCYGKSQAQIEGTAVCAAIAGPTGGKTETPGAGEAKISSYQLTYSEGKLSHKITFSGDIRSCQFNFARKEGSACVFNYRGDVKRMADEVLGISEAVFEKSAQGAAFVANKSTDMTKELAETAPDKLPITFDCEVVCQDTLGNSHYGKGSIALGSSEDAPKEGGLYDCNHNTFGPIKIGARICGVNNPGLFQCLGSSVKGGAGEWLPVDCEDERGEGWVDDCANKNPQCVLKSEAQSGEKLICKDNNDCYEKSGRDYYCLYKGLGGEIGFCSKEGGCFSPSNGNKNFYKGVIVCGGNGTSQYCANPTNPPSVSGWARTPDQNCPEDKGVCNRDTGFCEGGTATQGDCKLSSLNAGGPRERKSSCSGIYVPFTLNHQGDCSGKISCEVYDDYNQKTWPANCQSSDLLKTSSSNWEACVSVKSRYGDSGGSQVVKSAEIPDKINFEIECCLSDGSCVSGRSDYGNPFAKEDQEKKKEQEKSKEGGACETDKDCQEGLVCVDKKCVKKEDADKQKEEEKQNSIAPNVTISSPSGTIDTKTAQLSVTTDIAANCKYMLNQEGGLSAGNFDGAGMVLSGAGGTSHTATLSNLTNIQAANCKYNHSVTVLCKNSKASAGAFIAATGRMG